MTNLPPTRSRYDTDPEALAWARTKVQDEIDRCRKFAESATAADLALAFIRRRSRGASHTARLAQQAGIPVRHFSA